MYIFNISVYASLQTVLSILSLFTKIESVQITQSSTNMSSQQVKWNHLRQHGIHKFKC